MERITIFWFRRDLRIDDNTGLYSALKERGNVLPLFIFDTEILDELEDKRDLRVSFIYEQLQGLKHELEQSGSSLLVKFGKPAAVFEALFGEYNIAAVYANHDYEPYAMQRDEQLAQLLKSKGVEFRTCKDQVIFEKDEITKDDGLPYTVFTPYSRKWRAALKNTDFDTNLSETLLDRCFKTGPFRSFNLKDTGFEYNNFNYPDKSIDKEILKDYHKTRDIPSVDGTSRLSLHLRFGTISIRKLAGTALALNEVYLNELIWREFYMMILWHFPNVVENAFKPKYDNVRWVNDENQFEAWCEGKTGYPIVDAGMRQLNETGFMHNRVRMIAASFLTKHLLIDWRWGEAYFAKKLLDFELSSNNGGWQWAASSGCDAAPYFRVFSPELQTKKFDPKLLYIKKWVPEFQELTYPRPVIDHKVARERVLREYKRALGG
ncbi:MAG: DNA photolyase family protein [Bacteroidales bacterium]|nr:DNA photolyase family protein [Bacteroidales bacterium]